MTVPRSADTVTVAPSNAGRDAARDAARDAGSARPRVVILGGGFAGLHAARELKRADVDILMVDRTNHHLFQPLLYQVATATLAPSDIAVPIRWLMRKQKNTRVLMAEVTRVDVERRVVVLDEGTREEPYDYLLVATGARHSYFGHDEWEALAPGLKSIEDAFDIRRRFLVAFELAEKSEDAEERAAYQTFVIVGAGPTGVELAGTLPDSARHALREDFRRIDTLATRVLLLEGGPRVLPGFPEELSAGAEQDLRELGVEIRTNSVVTRIEPDAVYIGDERIPTRTVFWAAGNAASPVARTLGVPLDRAGRVLVGPDLSIPGHPEVFGAGDLAAVVWPRKDSEGEPSRSWQGGSTQDAPAPGAAAPADQAPAPRFVPGVAPAANQMGKHVGRMIRNDLESKPRTTFKYFDKGNVATIGRHKAVADFGFLRLEGRIAWFLWLFVHIMYLVGFRNRVSVLVQWAYAYFTYQRGVRLIPGPLRRSERSAPTG